MKVNKELVCFDKINFEIIDGVLFTQYHHGKISLECAREIIKNRLKYTNNKIYPAIITSSGTTEITKEARNLFRSKKGTIGLSAIALVYESSRINQVLMNFMLKMYTPAIPIKAFEEKGKALSWLQNHNQNPTT